MTRARARRDVLRLLRAERESLAAYGVRRLGLFGSFAAGKPTPASDVDLIVELEPPNFDTFMEVAERLERLLGRKVDVLTAQGLAGIRIKEVAKRIKRSIVYV